MESDFEVLVEDFGGEELPYDDSGAVSPKPWHKLRKHWVRKKQWHHTMRDVLKSNTYNEAKVINYFGFPGEDLLDIRVLGDYLNQKKLKLKVFGLESNGSNDGEMADMMGSRLSDLPYVDELSRIELSSFESLSSDKSKLHSEIRGCEPFNIVNLDFTGSVLSNGEAESRLNAIKNLLNNQFTRQYKPWLFFITTRIDCASVDVAWVSKIIEGPLIDNINEHEDFRESFNIMIMEDEEFNIKSVRAPEKLEDKFEKVYLISLLKWMLKNAAKSSVDMKVYNVGKYIVNKGSQRPDMASVVIKFVKKDYVGDAAGVVGDKCKVVEIDELSIALKIVDKVDEYLDIDEILEIDDGGFKSELKEDLINMLLPLGYDEGMLRSFLSE